MLDVVPLVMTTIGLICIFLYIFSTLQLSHVRKNWNQRRCESFVIAIAHLVPEDPEIDATQFAVDNFYYCLSHIIDSSVAGHMTPMLRIFEEQVNMSVPLNESLNYLRSNATSLLFPMNSMMDITWQRIRAFGYAVVQTFMRTYHIIDRIEALSKAIAYTGFGLTRTIMNLLDVVLNILKMLIAILAGLLVVGALVFGGALPAVITLMVTTVAAVSGFIALDGIGDTFCVAKGTMVAVADGWKAVELLRPGDALRQGVVEGVLKTSGKGGKYVVIDGIIISDCHLVFDEADKTWKSAGEHSSAAPYKEEQEFLYCLNTSSRTWIVKGGSDEFVLRDWEELPLDSSIDSEWEAAVYSILNKKNTSNKYAPRIARPGRGLLGKDTMIYEKIKGPVKLSEVSVGEYIKDGYNTFTKVLGVYEDIASVSHSGPNTAAWVWNSYSNTWSHPSPSKEQVANGARHLITESGIFLIYFADGEHFIRDFTEVGADRIEETYEFVRGLLNNSPK